MKLIELLNKINIVQVAGEAENKEIKSLTINSKEIKKGSMFIAVKGFKTDGHLYVSDAVANGAAAVVIEENSNLPDELFVKNDVVKIVVKNSRKSIAEISKVFYNNPSAKLKLIGITGTKGKTTTSYYLHNILKTAGVKSGLLGTNKYIIGNREIKSSLTTPEAYVINKLMNEMVEEKCTHCVMEVSSHSLKLNRVDYLDFDYAIFTNITSDHMDYHGTFENYLDAKKILFDNLKPQATAILNSDDKNWKNLIVDTKAEIKTYGTSSGADFSISDLEYDFNGTRFNINYLDSKYSLNTKLIGKFNAYNATAAFATLFLNGIDINLIINGINTTPQVPGRFEVLGNETKKVIIDYSHTAGSLKEALEAIHHINKEKLPVITVFGCGGNRDKFKRPEMGKIAEQLSDEVIVTSDNPRDEDPLQIINDILTGMSSSKINVKENREEAIKDAIKNSPANSIILIAGKGHEDYQEIKGERKHFSDKETALKYLYEN